MAERVWGFGFRAGEKQTVAVAASLLVHCPYTFSPKTLNPYAGITPYGTCTESFWNEALSQIIDPKPSNRSSGAGEGIAVLSQHVVRARLEIVGEQRHHGLRFPFKGPTRITNPKPQTLLRGSWDLETTVIIKVTIFLIPYNPT